MTETRSPKTEMERHKQAFEYFYALGSRRKYRLVASECQVSVSTIKNWSRDFRWRPRIEDRDAEITKVFAEKVKTETADALEHEIKLLDLIQVKGAKDLVDGRSRSTPNNMLKATEIKRHLLEKMQEDVEAEGKSVSARPILVMLDNGRGDRTIPLATGPDGKTEDEAERPEDTDND